MLDNGARVLFQGCSVCPSRLCEAVQLAGIVLLCALADGPGVSLGVCLMEDIWVDGEGGRSVSHLFCAAKIDGAVHQFWKASMAVVYGLFCEQLCLYVGSTKRKEHREKEHRKGDGSGSSKIPRDMEWDFTVLEECDAKECRFRERHWYDILKPLYNQRRPRLTTEELAEQDRLAAIWNIERDNQRDALNKFLQDICVDIEYEHINNASFETDEDE